ncbi:MAG: LuxR C-terminal-related transcriptional regulator, partial [Pseudomonadota bacterium]
EVREAMGADLDQDAIDALQQQVEGWPVAVQMTRLLGNDNSKNRGSRADIVGSHGHVANYLVTNVLRSQPDELQEFLLETSILESFNVALADAVCGHDKSQALIRQLEPLQALVIPLDDDHEWIRYHHLFAECLKDLLKHEDPDRFAQLHRRAAKWCSENRMVAEAVNYANAIQDYDLSRQIINDNCEWIRLIYFGGVGYFNGLLANIPEDVISSDPRLLYSKVYANVLVGNYKQALQYHNAAELLMERDGVAPESLRDRLTTGTGLLCRVEYKMARDGGWLKDRLELAEKFEAESPEKDPRPVTLCCLALQCLFYGEFDEAWEYTRQAERGFGNVVALFCQINFGIIELWTNALDEARRRFESTSQRAVQMGGDQSNLKFICDTFVAAIDYWQNDLDADPDDRLEQLVLRVIECDGGYEVFNTGFDAVIHDALSRKDYERTDFLIDRLERSAERFAMQRLSQFAQQLRLDCAVAREDPGEAARMFEKVQHWLDVDEKALDDLGWRHKITAFYSCARYLGALDRHEDALAHVAKGLDEAERLNSVLIRVRGSILKASLLEQAQRHGEAVETLKHAIQDAARIGCTRAFAADTSPRLVRDAARLMIEDGNNNPMVGAFLEQLSSSHAKELLTGREHEVLLGLVDGKANKEIARDLDLTDNTVKFHVRNLYKKLEVTKRVNAVARARDLRILK